MFRELENKLLFQVVSPLIQMCMHTKTVRDFIMTAALTSVKFSHHQLSTYVQCMFLDLWCQRRIIESKEQKYKSRTGWSLAQLKRMGLDKRTNLAAVFDYILASDCYCCFQMLTVWLFKKRNHVHVIPSAHDLYCILYQKVHNF